MKKIFLSLMMIMMVAVYALPAKAADAKVLIWDVDSLTLRCGPYGYRMVYVPAGEFHMGATGKLLGGSGDLEKPTPLVETPAYLIGETEVPQWLWTAVMGKNPSKNKGDLLPVENVSAIQVRDFLERLNTLTNALFRLPTEVEWEFAAREGSSKTNNLYSGSDDFDAVAWHKGNSKNKSHEVKTRQPNALGIYDLTGNVSEICANGLYRYGYGTVINPFIYEVPQMPAVRGGNWRSDPWQSRISNRGCMGSQEANPFVGFRLAY